MYTQLGSGAFMIPHDYVFLGCINKEEMPSMEGQSCVRGVKGSKRGLDASISNLTIYPSQPTNTCGLK